MQADNEHDDLSAFRKFIEDALDFDKTPDDPPVAETATPETPYSELPPDDNPYPNLHRDIADIWMLLQKEHAGSDYYAHMLTPLEQATRAELERLIMKRLRAGLPRELTNRQLRSIVAYSMTMGWLVLASLLDKLQDGDAGLDLGDDIDLDDPIF